MVDTSFSEGQNMTADMKDYYELLKPKVMRLVIFTAFVGMFVAPGSIHPMLAFIALLAIALGAGASGALNMYIDQDIDAIMKRTQSRPIPSGRVPQEHALYLGVFLSIFSVCVLGLYTNWFAAGFLAFTIFFYVVIYSLFLKRNTPQNIVIGGAAGAFPPMVGWAAVTGGVSFEGIMMFLVIFLWTPPHFWALALFRNEDYQRAKIPMMPVVKGQKSTRLQILVYSIMLALVSIATAFTNIGGAIVLIAAILGSIAMIGGAYKIWKNTDYADYSIERKYFFATIVFLFAFFLAIILQDIANLYFQIPFWSVGSI